MIINKFVVKLLIFHLFLIVGINNINGIVLNKIGNKNAQQFQCLNILFDHWSCGFHTLYNADLVEDNLGLKKHQQSNFKKICKEYINLKKIDPCKGTNSVQLMEMADKLGLHNYYVLNLNESNLIELSGISFHIEYQFSSKYKTIFYEISKNERFKIAIKYYGPKKPSKKELDRITKEIRTKEYRNILLNLKSELNTNLASKSNVLHFVCSLPNPAHWILISVIKNTNQEISIQLHDNLNANVDETRKKYIDQIYELFCN
ncbi:hypothetical protein M1446_02455 [Candidatus Dependentiae bacterium]|nr:hypothetical protein [Candidatus Dependentiae bacterium]